MSPDLNETWHAAVAARENAHAPYSRYQVGAAFRLSEPDGIAAGCNVENASYGGTLCAERVAVGNAVAARGPGVTFAYLVLVTESPAPPCGLCLQVLSEFVGGTFPVYLATPEGIARKVTLDDLLPIRFDNNNLNSPHE